MKIVVTGGAGFIGSHLADKLIELGHRVIVIDNLSTGNIDNINYKAEFHQLDIGEDFARDVLKKLLKNVDYVFHLAANARVMECLENPFLAHDSNVAGTINVLEACRKNDVKKIIHTSTCSVYGIPLEINMPITEVTKIDLVHTYGATKYMQEIYVDLFTKLYGLSSVILRYFNVYGTKRQAETGAYPNVLAAFSRQKREFGKVFVTGDGEQTRDFVHVFDVVDANIKAMESDFKNAEIFNIGSGKRSTINELADRFDCEVEYIEPRPAEARHLYSDCTKAKQSLNWEPTVPLKDGIDGYINS